MTTYPFPWKFEAQNYTEFYLVSQVSEAQVQASIVDMLRLFFVDVVPVDAGGRRQRGRMMAAAKKAGIQLAGVQNVKTGAGIKGFADLEATLAPEGRALYIEVKAPAWLRHDKKVIRRAGTPSDEQLRFLLSKHERGALVLVAWSAIDVVNYLQKDLDLNRRAML